MSKDPIRVGSGTFRVDRGRMLAKLALFQLPTPTAYLDSWLRAASSGGATFIDIITGPAEFWIRFDGKPFSREQLETVYDALFDPSGPDGRRRQYLALGLLGCLRPSGAAVEVASGSAAARVVWSARSLDEESLSRAEDDSSDTVIRVFGPGAATREALLERARLVSAPQTRVDGEACASGLEPADHSEPRVRFARPELEAVVSRDLSGENSSIRLFVDGVWANDFPVDGCPASIWGCATSRALKLDAGKGKVVLDAAFQEVLGVVRKAALQLFEETLAGQRRRLRLAGKLLLAKRRLRGLWEEECGRARPRRDFKWMLGEAGKGLATLAAGRVGDEDRETIAAAARVTRWLRNAALHGTRGWQDSPSKPSDTLKPAWTAPVFLDWHAKPLSLLELRTALESEGSFSWSSIPTAKRARQSVVWAVSDADLVDLHAAFPGVLIPDLTPFARG